MNRIQIVFNAGLLLGMSALVLASFGIVIPAARELLTVEVLLAYVVVGVCHVVILGLLGRKLPFSQREHVESWLYTAGFIHTFIALGIAIVSTGSTLAAAERILPADLGLVLAPMGAAVVPHALGVWIGHFFESQNRELGVASANPVAFEPDVASDGVADLYERREELLKAEIESLERQVDLWNRFHRQLSTTSTEALRQMAELATATGGVADSAQRQVKYLAAEMTMVTQAVARSVKPPVAELAKAMSGLQEKVEDASQSLQAICSSLESAAGDGAKLKMSIRETIVVIEGLGKVQESIVELLSKEIFRRT